MKEDEWLCCCLETVSGDKTLDVLKKGNELEGKLWPQFPPRVSFLRAPHNRSPCTCGALTLPHKEPAINSLGEGEGRNHRLHFLTDESKMHADSISVVLMKPTIWNPG